MPETFGFRMLNPFTGVVNVIATDEGAAETLDGVRWTLYVRGECVTVANGGVKETVQLREVRYGIWEHGTGLRRLPVRNPNDIHRVDRLGHRLLAAVEAHAPNIPFALTDNLERWLVDDDGAPLALIASACPGDPFGEGEPPAWRIGQKARRGMSSPRCPDAPTTAEACGRMESVVNGAATGVRWFKRDQTGAGRALDGRGGRLGATDFPELLVRKGWDEPRLDALFAALLAWQAPRLLQLQRLGDAARAALEREAVSDPVELAARHHLFPRKVDAARITAALVEGRLRGLTGPESRTDPARDLFPFFNE